jgi:triosephosphate isomerase
MAQRRPLALANWKMAMTIAESLAFVQDFQRRAGDLPGRVDVIICPPFTALWAVGQALAGSLLHLGAQDVADSTEMARTGQVSAPLLADAGCRWVMLGHWEVRRTAGDDDAVVNRKLHLALAAGLTPILLVGEGRDEWGSRESILERHLIHLLAGCAAEEAAQLVFIYEPEAAIGLNAPTSPQQVAEGCAFIRGYMQQQWGKSVAEAVRIIYGGSVSPEHAAALLSSPDVDGLGASRRGRDPATFVEIVRQVAGVKG